MKQEIEDWPKCHFTYMELDCGDNGNGGCEYFYICKHCGHTKEAYTEWRAT